jgi:carboxymethylenebutenolidase
MSDDCGGGPDRRSFLAGSVAALAGIAAAADPPETRVLDRPEMKAVEHGKVKFPSAGKEIGGYLARPRAEGKYPAVLVLPGNRITEEHYPNTCAALALAGFVGLVPDSYHAVPDSAKTVGEINRALANWKDEDYLRDIRAAADHARSLAYVRADDLGVLGFCVGGRRALLVAAGTKGFGAVVAFHPGAMKREEVAKLKAPVQIHHGTADRAISIDASRKLEGWLRSQGTPVELYAYEGADHGFLAYTHPDYYAPAAAKLAWGRTAEFLKRHLKG